MGDGDVLPADKDFDGISNLINTKEIETLSRISFALRGCAGKFWHSLIILCVLVSISIIYDMSKIEHILYTLIFIWSGIDIGRYMNMLHIEKIIKEVQEDFIDDETYD